LNFLKKLSRLLHIEKGLLGVSSGNAIASITGGLFWLLIASLLTPEEYGELNYYLSVGLMFGTLSIFGLNTTVITFLSKGNNIIKYQAYFFVLLSNVVLFIVLLVFIKHLPAVSLLVGFSFFTMSLAEDLGKQNYKRYSITVILQRAFNITLSLSLYFIMGIDGIIIGYALSTILFSYNFFRSVKKFRFQFNDLKKNFSFIVHCYSLEISGNVSNHIDKLLIAPLFGFVVLGLYQIGFQFLVFMAIIPMSMFQFLLPRESAGINDKTTAIKGLSIAVIVCIVFFITIPYIISSFFPNFIESIMAAQIMIFGIIPSTVNAILNSRLFGTKKSTPVFISAITRICSLIILMVILGSQFGLIGLSISVVMSLILQSVTLLVFFKFNFSKNR